MQSLPDLMRRFGPKLLTGNGRGRQAPGWAELRLLLEQWAEVVGPHNAELTSPQGVKFCGQDRRDGTLVIAAPGALRLELQHDSQIILERANRLFGYSALSALQLVQGQASLPDAPPQYDRPVSPTLLEGIDSEALRETLSRFGARLPQKGDQL